MAVSASAVSWFFTIGYHDGLWGDDAPWPVTFRGPAKLRELTGHGRRRLTAHLGCALVIYSSLIWLGLNVVTRGKALAPADASRGLPSRVLLYLPVPLTFATAMSGAQVAGLDAGLIYNDTLVIDAEERAHDYSARKQWHHRVMGVTTTATMVDISDVLAPCAAGAGAA